MSHTEHLEGLHAKIDVILQRLAQLEERMTRQEAL